ncbi:hypothetical protein HPULCUR_009589 [Helicostylum pulchrum]|uniref:Uncharacterized protein n=1 Tax=Helicostylum pulchrum TaxID=562976 RepID=A0ABP9YAU8_9FUNG
MSGKQPIEGLTVRIWDPPSSEKDNSKKGDNLSKGSRGYREYTEQAGSEKLKYSTHDWDDKPKQELKKSTRDWDAEKKKLESVQDLPLVSRTDTTDSQRCEKESDKQ